MASSRPSCSTHGCEREVRPSVLGVPCFPARPCLAPPAKSGTSSQTQHLQKRRHLLGTLEESLLRDRMPTPPGASVPFVAQISVTGRSRWCRHLQMPRPVEVPFQARVYSTEADERPLVGPATCSQLLPYAGDIGVSAYYATAIESHAPQRSLRKLQVPGYAIPDAGQIQLILKSYGACAARIFLIPYNVSSMPAGHKTILRHRVYAQSAGTKSPHSTVQVRICRPERLSEAAASSRGLEQPKGTCPLAYLYGAVNVVFHARAPCISDGTRSETMCLGDTDGWALYEGPGDHWLALLRCVKKQRHSAARAASCGQAQSVAVKRPARVAPGVALPMANAALMLRGTSVWPALVMGVIQRCASKGVRLDAVRLWWHSPVIPGLWLRAFYTLLRMEARNALLSRILNFALPMLLLMRILYIAPLLALQ